MSATCAVGIFGTQLPLAVVLAAFTLLGVALPLAFNWAFMSRKDRTEANQTRFENAADLLAKQTDRSNEFTSALAKAVRKPKPAIEDIHAVMSTGEAYFQTIRVMSQAVLEGRVTDSARDRDFVPKISDALLKNIPLYYKTLAAKCTDYGIPYDGAFRESDYEGPLLVADRHDHETWLKVRPLLEPRA